MLIDNLSIFSSNLRASIHKKSSKLSPNFRVRGDSWRRNRRILGFVIPNAKRGQSPRKKSWWKRFFLEEDGNWLGLREEDMEEDVDELETSGNGDEKLSEEEKFEAWKKRAEAIIELREAQEGLRNQENRYWEDWLVFDEESNGVKREWDDSDELRELKEEDVVGDPNELIPERGLVKTIRDLVLGVEEDDLLYEDRVFRFASRNSVWFFI